MGLLNVARGCSVRHLVFIKALRGEVARKSRQQISHWLHLKAQTTMVNSSKKAPVTYLNKGQIYTLSVVGSNSPTSSTGLIRYRTYVCISFEDTDQRSKPTTCWKLWEEIPGLNKAQKGRKIRAVALSSMWTHRGVIGSMEISTFKSRKPLLTVFALPGQLSWPPITSNESSLFDWVFYPQISVTSKV